MLRHRQTGKVLTLKAGMRACRSTCVRVRGLGRRGGGEHVALFFRGPALNDDGGRSKLQALGYDILPSTTAVFSYAIGSRKLSPNEQFFCWSSNSSKFATNNSNKTRHVIYSRQQSLHQRKWNHKRLNRDGTLFLTRGGCVSCLRACFGARLLLQSY